MTDCLFCKIIKGDIPSYKIWANDTHIAFLDIFPVVEGMTIVIPKQHYPSYFAKLDDEVVANLMKAAKKVAQLLDTKLENVMRTKLILEGIEVNHLHAKLYPMYRDGGYVSELGERASTKELEKVMAKLRS